MLTFETIRKIFEEEKSKNTLAELPDNFFQEIMEYVKKKSELSRDESEQWEVDSVKNRLRTIFELRERKILAGVLTYLRTGEEPEKMISEEKEFLLKVSEIMKEFQTKRDEKFEDREERRMVISLLDDIPKFVGINVKNYGPFKKGEIARVPEPNARLLIEKGHARKMNVKS